MASASPRRAELLARFGLTFEIWPAHIDERLLPQETPQAHVARLAAEKAARAHTEFPGHVVLAGDTVVVLDNQVMGKPQSLSHARDMLLRLSGRAHSVLTGYHLLDGPSGQTLTGVVETQVVFRPLSPAMLDWYLATGEPMDKAGAYGIQELGGLLVERMAGSFNNVVGFPVEEILWRMLQQGWLTW